MLFSSKDPPSFSAPRGFVVFEGVNGAGKSTLISGLLAALKSRQVAAMATFEPGDTKLGGGIRRLLLERQDSAVSPLAELLLFAADRAQHVDELIKPALQSNKLVLCDRYTYSSKAFQGYGRSLDLNLIDRINSLATSGLVPDLVILLDLDAAEGLRRSSSRNASIAESASACGKSAAAPQHDHFEAEQLDFHRRLRQGFLEIAERSAEPFVVIDAARPASDVLGEAVFFIDILVNSMPAIQKAAR